MDIDTILVPIDFDAPSEHALDTAISIARQLKAKIALLHAFDDAELRAHAPLDLALEVRTRATAAAAKALEGLMEARRSSGVEMKSLIKEGETEDLIVSSARDEHAGLVVMGTHGRRGLGRALLGSVAARVIRACDVPVMVVPPPAKAAKASS